MGETQEERRNRELIVLLNELRVALPGVQVLFAFLLAVPFANGFPKLGKLDRDIFFVNQRLPVPPRVGGGFTALVALASSCSGTGCRFVPRTSTRSASQRPRPRCPG